MIILIIYKVLIVLLMLNFIGSHSFFYSRKVHVLNFQLAFIFKLFAAFTMTVIYTRVYTDRSVADIFRYYDDSKVLLSLLQKAPGDFFHFIAGADIPHTYQYKVAMNNWDEPEHVYHNNRLMILLNLAIGIFSMGDYYVHAIIFTFLSFIGLTAIFKVFNKIYNVFPGIVFIAVFTLPSIIFWTSGVLKESVVMLAMGLMLYSFMRFYFNSALWYHFVTFIFAFALLLLLKFYILILVLPALAMIYMCQRISFFGRHVVISWTAFVVLIFSVVFSFRFINPQADALQAIIHKREAFEQLAHTMKAGSYFATARYYDFEGLLKATPMALINVLGRPHIFNFGSFLIYCSALENLMIWFLIIIALRFRKSTTSFIASWNLFCLFVVISTFVIIGLTVPIEGAIVRYKSVVLPLLMALLLCNIDYKKLFLRFPKVEKYFHL